MKSQELKESFGERQSLEIFKIITKDKWVIIEILLNKRMSVNVINILLRQSDGGIYFLFMVLI